MTDSKTTILRLKKRVDQFVKERDWQQFHTAKNISTSIAIETAELMEHFQWDDYQNDASWSAKKKVEIADEVADIVVYALDFCNAFNIDLAQAIDNKIKKNEKKYPVKKVKGKSHKYTYYQQKKKAQ
jgi:dCTP diphosphatase